MGFERYGVLLEHCPFFIRVGEDCGKHVLLGIYFAVTTTK